MSKESRKMRGIAYAKYKQARDLQTKAPIYTQAEFKRLMTKASRSPRQRGIAERQAQVLLNQSNALSEWRSQGSRTTPWGIKYQNSLSNPKKGYLIKHIFDMQKKGLINLRELGLSTGAENYNDIVNWGLDELNDDQLTEVIMDYATESSDVYDIDWSTGKKIKPRS